MTQSDASPICARCRLRLWSEPRDKAPGIIPAALQRDYFGSVSAHGVVVDQQAAKRVAQALDEAGRPPVSGHRLLPDRFGCILGQSYGLHEVRRCSSDSVVVGSCGIGAVSRFICCAPDQPPPRRAGPLRIAWVSYRLFRRAAVAPRRRGIWARFGALGFTPGGHKQA
jgi:hypothetical protein